MKAQSRPYFSKFVSTHSKSIRRLALIAPFIFGVAVVLGYTATAKAPALLQRIISSRSVQAPVIDPGPNHRMRRLLRLANALEPIVFTDKPNYQPGETVLITGSGFAAIEIVTLQVVHADGMDEGGSGHEPWNVMTDEFGNFVSTWFVDPDDSAGEMFRLTAIGNTSGLVAETTFLDGSANLDTCANGPTSAPALCTGAN